MVVLGLLGGGTTPPGYARIIAARYDKHRGLALGLMIAGLGVVAISAPMVMTKDRRRRLAGRILDIIRRGRVLGALACC